jgi:hypothetical protein
MYATPDAHTDTLFAPPATSIIVQLITNNGTLRKSTVDEQYAILQMGNRRLQLFGDLVLRFLVLCQVLEHWQANAKNG